MLLAPACSSFDQFENYEQRGRVFKELVAKLEEHRSRRRAVRARHGKDERCRVVCSLTGNFSASTLALCLIGAVMVFSASAVTAREEYGNGYTFLMRQLLWIAIGIAGMFWLMNTDYRKLRQPRVIFTALSVTLVLLIAVFFLDRSHADASLDSAGAAELPAVGTREAGGDFLSRVVSRNRGARRAASA